MGPKRLMAMLVVCMLAMGLVIPYPRCAWADAETGTTEVAVQAGSDWGQSTKTVKVVDKQKPTLGDLARTGDPAFWIPVGMAGAACASGGLLLLKRADEKEDGEGHGGQ